jgi:hypothetical protein
MKRPTKFAIMRHNRRCSDRRRSLGEFEEIGEEARAFGYDDSKAVFAALCANDAAPPMDDEHFGSAKVRRWWWPLAWGR